MQEAPERSNDVSDTHESLLAAIRASTPRSLGGDSRESVLSFLSDYFADVPASELSRFSPDDLNGSALSHWELASSRQPGECRLRVSNPALETHGWQSPHSVIQLLVDDQPWLLASLRAALNRAGHRLHLLVHPIFSVERDTTGRLECVSAVQGADDDPQGACVESFIQIQLIRVADDALPGIQSLVENTLATLSAMRRDQETMKDRLRQLAQSCSVTEAGRFLDWLADSQFACFGTASLVRGEPEQALGVLADNATAAQWNLNELIPEDARQIIHGSEEPLLICKASQMAPVIRNEHADLIVLLGRNSSGAVTITDVVLGLFVPGLQTESTDAIPWVRERVADVIEASKTAPDSYDGKTLASVLRGFPRDMLLQTDRQELLCMARGIVGLHERQHISLFQTTDPMGRFCHCLVYIPRDTYSRELRLDIESILRTHIDGRNIEFHTRFSSESTLATLYFAVEKRPPLNRQIDWPTIEQRIQQAAITWEDNLTELLHLRHDETQAQKLVLRYGSAFPPGYREDYSARVAVADINFIEAELGDGAPAMSFYRQILADAGTINFKLFAVNQPVSLSDVLPIIENMGLRVAAEHPFEIRRADASTVWIHEFTVQQSAASLPELSMGEQPKGSPDNKAASNVAPAQRIQSAFTRIWQGDVENDGLNRLILDAGLHWHQVVVLRAYGKFLLQASAPFSQAYMTDSLVANPLIARQLIEYFEVRFDPEHSTHDTTVIENEIQMALDSVASLDEDRILRAFLNLMQSTLRTSFYCTSSPGDAGPRDHVSFKFDSANITDLPLPRPMAEIFVYSPRVEGVHLRGGLVARGGLRWSDRREDFRTEVLGLMKAQMVKNAVIVPLGSKGGFYVKVSLPEHREAAMQVVVDCYKTFLRGLLDITDNIVDNQVVTPDRVVRHDGDDPYLVVAADKGTATFSDYANAVSADYGFWLGDAFASGGSAGYDHKKMGITARGAWESVKRHFRELGHDTQSETFTVAGVGDMAGDVFGNGMLLSNQIRLVAAFNHRHIFIDPDPDAASGFAERQRLFELPRSSWEDYDLSLLSDGGGIFSRLDKRITISKQAQQALGTDEESFTPNELISVILQAPVDLLWNGGIGTYVKASTESHQDAADRGNDSVRVNANQIRARVIGEGGNLGLTQRARIEFAKQGGLIYTDAIDNSAGVDCSDHEVNIKILLNAVVSTQDMTVKQRDALMVDMTDTVASLVLTDNYLQTQCIDLCESQGPIELEEQSRFMQYLESIGRLNREIEFLPDHDEIADLLASDHGLTRPQLAVLVSYSKMVMYEQLLASDLPQDPYLELVLREYFPDVLVEQHGDRVAAHRLRPEIIATVVTNELVNRLGPTFAFRMKEELGAGPQDIARAFVAARAIFHMPTMWSSIESLDNSVSSATQHRMHILVRGLVERATQWLLRARRNEQGIDAVIAEFEPGIRALVAAMPDCLASINRDTLEQRLSHFTADGVPAETALAVAQVVPMSSSLDIVEIASSLNLEVGDIATVYFELGMHLELEWLRDRIGELRIATPWHTLARSELRRDLHYQQRHLCAEIMISTDAELAPADRVQNWATSNPAAVDKYAAMMVDMRASSAVDFAMLSLAVNEVHKLLRSSRPLASA